MEKRTLYALLAVVALGVIAFAVMRAPEKGQRKGPPPRPVAEIKAADIGKLELTNDKNEKTVLEKTGASEWRVKSPGDWKADQQGVKQVLDGLEKLSFADVASENVDKQAELGVADGKGARIVAKNGDGATIADLHVGKAVGGYTMVRVDGKNETWQAGGIYPYVVARAPNGWRDHAIFELTAADIDKLTVESAGRQAGGAREGARRQGQGRTTPSGRSSRPRARRRRRRPISTRRRSTRVVSGAVEPARRRLRRRQEGRRRQRQAGADRRRQGQAAHAVGGRRKGRRRLRGVERRAAGLHGQEVLDRAHRASKPIDYRDKTIVKAKEADLQSVEITDGNDTTTLTQGKDGKWTRARAPPTRPRSSRPSAASTTWWRRASATTRSRRRPGSPSRRGARSCIIKGKPPVTITVGAATKDGDYYVQKSGSPDVYLVKKYRDRSLDEEDGRPDEEVA